MDRHDLADSDGDAMTVDAASLPVQPVPSHIMVSPMMALLSLYAGTFGTV
jgi:hypothetical protein